MVSTTDCIDKIGQRKIRSFNVWIQMLYFCHWQIVSSCKSSQINHLFMFLSVLLHYTLKLIELETTYWTFWFQSISQLHVPVWMPCDHMVTWKSLCGLLLPLWDLSNISKGSTKIGADIKMKVRLMAVVHFKHCNWTTRIMFSYFYRIPSNQYTSMISFMFSVYIICLSYWIPSTKLFSLQYVLCNS